MYNTENCVIFIYICTSYTHDLKYDNFNFKFKFLISVSIEKLRFILHTS